MERKDFSEFVSLIDMLLENFKRPSFSNNTIEMWFDACCLNYTISDIKRAVLKICTDRKWGSFCPTLGEFLDFLSTPVQREKRIMMKYKIQMILEMIIRVGRDSVIEIPENPSYIKSINFSIGRSRKKLFLEPDYIDSKIEEILENFIQISLGRLVVGEDLSVWKPAFSSISDETQVVTIGVSDQVKVIKSAPALMNPQPAIAPPPSFTHFKDALRANLKKYGRFGKISLENVDDFFDENNNIIGELARKKPQPTGFGA